mmetsp:Transcript_11897/g.27790  ORF Transcript_11897/g.27790 Transcript_11897/m.27790 type:complete len:439 (+) Transcript_11897:167-1483(+)
MLSYRAISIPSVSRGSLRKIYGIGSNQRSNQTFQHWQAYRDNPFPKIQSRTSSRKTDADAGKGLLSRTTPVKKESTITLTRVAYAVKLVRLPFLLVAMSTIGYQRGVNDAIRNPLKLQQGAFEAMLAEFEVESEDEIEIITERGVRSRFDTPLGSLGNGKIDTKDPRGEKIARVGKEILTAAKTYVRAEFNFAVKEAKEEIMKDEVYVKDKRLAKLINQDPEVEYWVRALEHIEGASLEGIENWSYVLISSPIPNAFVSEMLPQKIFITTGLFDKFVNNDDELALILGHEISHLIMGHLSVSSLYESIIRGAEILVLMLDPTEGLLSLGIASFLSKTREAVVASFSRTHEVEADELGCRLAAMACYDTRRGVEVFRKMQEEAVRTGNASNQNMMSSHPPSQERYNNLQLLAETQNFSNYSFCNTMRKRISRILKEKQY